MNSVFNPLIPAIFALGGTIIGALGSGIIPNIIQNRAAYKSFRRQKLEELYEDLNRWINTAFGIHVLNFNLVLMKEKDWNWYLDQIIDSDIDKEIKFFKSEIIINLYFKELIADFIHVTEAIQDLNSTINKELKETYLAGRDMNIFKPVFDTKVNTMITLAGKFKDHIKNMAVKI